MLVLEGGSSENFAARWMINDAGEERRIHNVALESAEGREEREDRGEEGDEDGVVQFGE